jgi:hypothetical protein
VEVINKCRKCDEMGKTTEQVIAGILSLSESTYLRMRQPNGNNNATT